ncbi:glycosyltransferase [Olsenella sp. kh2p3]|uniref:glycosyltransferase n=1 Tax=Olsenella sp. kh2p3 TaxID=1797112 RepID=UPI00091420CB|nr:glycosyltransferase [Olsenella sp. kh2p3]SFW98905.1 Glycosyl transferase family 2 [Olsenella sp. kh2p3]
MSDIHQPLVSVLVPIYNVETYLEQCLSSLAAQTLKDIEVICINDGSTDSSPAIIRSFMNRDPRFHLVDKENSGYGDSMNRGLDAARGKYVAILESDDFMEPDGLEYMVEQAERASLEVFKCNFWLYWSKPTENHSFRHNLYFPLASPEMIEMGPHAPVDYPEVFWSKASIWSALYLRGFLEENHIRFLPTPGASYQDSSFTFKVLACAHRIAYSGRAFVHYRQDNEKSSVNSKGKVFCTCDEHAEMRRFLDEDRPDLKAALDPIRAHVKFLNYRWNYGRLTPDLRPTFLERFSVEMREEVERGAISRGYFDGTLRPSDDDQDRFRYFEPWEIDEVADIMNEPAYFAAHFASETSPDRAQTVRTYWEAGGPRYLLRVLRDKASK